MNEDKLFCPTQSKTRHECGTFAVKRSTDSSQKRGKRFNSAISNKCRDTTNLIGFNLVSVFHYVLKLIVREYSPAGVYASRNMGVYYSFKGFELSNFRRDYPSFGH